MTEGVNEVGLPDSSKPEAAAKVCPLCGKPLIVDGHTDGTLFTRHGADYHARCYLELDEADPTPAATPEALIESLRLDAQSDYGQGWNKGMADAVAMLRADGWLRATAVPFALELDDYEAANLLQALVTHPCLNSGDWYLQIRHKLDRWTLTTAPNPIYCQRNGGH